MVSRCQIARRDVTECDAQTERMRASGVARRLYAAAMHAWWKNYPAQRYWMEKLSRPLQGEELFAPKSKNWSHQLLQFVMPGDVVLHWRSGEGFIGTSVVLEGASVGTRVWAGRAQECWVVPLAEFEAFERIISLTDVREVEAQLMRAQTVLESAYDNYKYFPFNFSPYRPLRAHQAYFTKFPVELFEILALVGLELPVVFDIDTGQALPRVPTTAARGGPRFLSDTQLRLAIERYSVAAARQWYERRGARDVTELGKPYDLELTLASKIRRVEVKGSSLPRVGTVLLTTNEVQNARVYPYTDLVVVDAIQFVRDDDQQYVCYGGELRRWQDWYPEDRHLRNLQLEYELPSGSDAS